MATHNEICAKDRKMFESLLAPKKQHNLNAVQDSGLPLSVILSHTLSQSLCCFLSFHVPEILGMPHWSSLADLCREHGAMEHPSSSCWQLVAGTFNWNKSLHKICQFVAMHTHTHNCAHIQYVSCSAATTPISPLHTRCSTRPMARRYPCCHCQYLSLFTAHSQRLFASILDLLLPSSSASSSFPLSPTRLGSWVQISKILQLTLLLVCHTMAWHYWLGYKRVLVSSSARKSESCEKISHNKRSWQAESPPQLYLSIRQTI